MFRKILLAFAFTLSSASWGTEYTLIVPNGPGSGVDTVARAVQKTYQMLTGNTLVIDYAPGADTLIAVDRFKKNPRSLLIGTSTMLSVNPVFKNNIP